MTSFMPSVEQLTSNLASNPIETLMDLAGLNKSDIPGDELMNNVLKESLNSNGILRYFNQMLMGYRVNGKVFQPDINGYSFIFMLPPWLSGYDNNLEENSLTGVIAGRISKYINSVSEKLGGVISRVPSSLLSRITHMFCFLAVDFTPPNIEVGTMQVSSNTGSISYGTEVDLGGQISITYIDTADLEVFLLHKLWIDYINQVTRGEVKPRKNFYDPSYPNEFGIIDYATSVYVMRCKPISGFGSVTKLGGEINYLGKAVGIFPLNLPDKEIIGRRDSNELTTLSITYPCAEYRQTTGHLNDWNNWIFGEFMTFIGSEYMGSIEQFTGFLKNLTISSVLNM